MAGFMQNGLPGIVGILEILKLRDFLSMQAMSEAEIEDMDERLKRIPNCRAE